MRDVDWVAAFIALIAAVVSGYFAFQARKSERESISVSKLSWVSTYLDQVRLWASEACDCLSDSAHLCELDPARMEDSSFFLRRHELRVRISSLIDRGRWFFPNKTLIPHGQNNPTAFRGFRNETLDPLVMTYRALGQVNYRSADGNPKMRDDIIAYKKEFVSRIHELVEPIHRSRRATSFLDEIAEQGGDPNS